MSYIGKTPTAVPLTSSDITDGIITSAKITDGTITSADTDGTLGLPPFKNIIINGDMSIAQRSTSASSLTSTGYHSIDRFVTLIDSMGTWTQSQSTTVPSGQGFAKSLKMDNTTADGSPSAGDRIFVYQKFEGQNLQYLKKGTSSAQSLTASFWVRSNKTGTYICELNDNDNSRKISQSYTISSADTWEKKTLTFAGDTTGALDNDNANSFHIAWWLGAGTTYSSGTLQTSWGGVTQANRAVGQVNLADSTSNEWYITGVQLEAGASASDFEFLPVDVNLQRCQRYFYKLIDVPGGDSGGYFASGYMYNSSIMYSWNEFPTIMRASPTLSFAQGTDYYNFYRNGAGDTFSNFDLTIGRTNGAMIRNYDDMSGSGGQAGGIHSTSNSKVSFSSEL
nr:putative carbohydrate binding domain containing protein [uncultured Mediterranean phage uvMED]